jgi:uncharacterized membrane protein YhaH (DUF805 family)
MKKRIGRLEYFTGVLLLLSVFGVAYLASLFIFESAHVGVLLIIGLAVVRALWNVPRLRDLDQWWGLTFLSFIPLVSSVLGLYLIFAKGTRGPNQYGNRPPRRIFLWTNWRADQKYRRVRQQAVALHTE